VCYYVRSRKLAPCPAYLRRGMTDATGDGRQQRDHGEALMTVLVSVSKIRSGRGSPPAAAEFALKIIKRLRCAAPRPASRRA
jgi:hypothetical protein